MNAVKNYLGVAFGTKTGRTAILGILGVAVAYLNGDMQADAALAALYVGFQSIHIRDAVKKSGPEAK